MTKTILITGTSKGIGKQLAESYLNLGYRVIGCSRSNPSIKVDNYCHFCLDICDEKLVVSMVRQIKKEFGAVDILINNAGIASMNHILTTTLDRAKAVFDTNFMGTFLLTREVSKQMIKSRSGVIINFTTVAVPLNLEGEAVYSASKAAIESFTRIAAKELGQFGIRVNAIGPVPMDTNLISHVPEAKIKAILELQINKRKASVEDIKNVIDFFISDASEMITGQVLYLGGIAR